MEIIRNDVVAAKDGMLVDCKLYYDYGLGPYPIFECEPRTSDKNAWGDGCQFSYLSAEEAEKEYEAILKRIENGPVSLPEEPGVKLYGDF